MAEALDPLANAAALSARKSLGQHFLLDRALVARIVAAAGPMAGVHAVEIGPGPGALTAALLASAAESVTAIELDPRAVALLRPAEAAAAGRLRILEADALSVDIPALVPPPRRIVANLPYNVASPLLLRWLREAEAYLSLTLMFQQEVAERICAAPDTPEYGRLSVLAQWRCEAALLLRLPPGAFRPPPRVWSAVVGLVPRAAAPDPALFAAMERVTGAAFGQRRKMLRGSLKALGDAEGLLAAAGLDGARRAETLSVAEFARLAEALRARG
ncbi:MAG: 16S rRNA (adenine(1518)-N(6)/adenine(1519)-N(6))-dimethyltransferase RsmA [Acetobacteraceae bacterium]|nr:16S rRNA (adenine(1518)-N(6)/adenine(1519)-N(6))-dimethyltransferase RsmA [Acetobacteraceae bacterium]MDW8398984.1 16S rRNA (adenine(1518)-N(6)/adenine(1519)-N(6))-dimethyltransferase RsmA [Acetobacteraceae bacterium]